MDHDKQHAAWNRIQELGGHGVWESDMVVVSLANTNIHDDDLALFADFPNVQILDVGNNPLTDACIKHLSDLERLATLRIDGTNISDSAIETFKLAHPSVEIESRTIPEGTVNPFTGKPLDA